MNFFFQHIYLGVLATQTQNCSAATLGMGNIPASKPHKACASWRVPPHILLHVPGILFRQH
jgi:hypothetical protein